MVGFLIYALFFILWYMFGFGDFLDNPNEIIYGMPSWFFYSSVVSPLILIIMIFIYNKTCDNLEKIDEDKH